MLRFRGRENDDDRTGGESVVHGGHKVRNGDDDIDTGDDDASVRGALVQKLKHASFLVFVTLMTTTINSVDLSTYIQWLAMMPRRETITIDSNDLTFYLYTCLLVSFRTFQNWGGVCCMLCVGVEVFLKRAMCYAILTCYCVHSYQTM